MMLTTKENWSLAIINVEDVLFNHLRFNDLIIDRITTSLSYTISVNVIQSVSYMLPHVPVV